MKLIVDSSVLIDYLRGGTTGSQLFDRVAKQDVELFIPTIVLFELLSGQSTKNTTKFKIISEFIKYFQRIELTESIAEWGGKIYRDISTTLQIPDYIIAASALEIGGTVATLNRKHFQKIPGLKIYPLDE